MGDVFNDALPPTVPVTAETVDALISISTTQRMFVSEHAELVKQEILKEKLDPKKAIGEWRLAGFPLSDEDAADVVRANPDLLSSLSFTHFTEMGVWARIASWFGYEDKDQDALNVADDLGFVVSVAEATEISGHILAAVSRAISGTPKVGAPHKQNLAFELKSSNHRGLTSLYLLLSTVHETRRTAGRASARALKVASSLHVFERGYLGGLTGVGVNISGAADASKDFATADIEAAELRSILAKKAQFLGNSTSNFVLASSDDSSKRAAAITLESTKTLLGQSNAFLTHFFEKEESKRREARKAVRLAAKAAKEEAEAAAAEAAAEAAQAERDREELARFAADEALERAKFQQNFESYPYQSPYYTQPPPRPPPPYEYW